MPGPTDLRVPGVAQLPEPDTKRLQRVRLGDGRESPVTLAGMTNDDYVAAKRRYSVGSEVTGTVDRVASFGIFVSVEGVRRYGVVADVAGMHKDAADDSVVIWPEAGDSVTGVVVEHSEHNEELKIHLT